MADHDKNKGLASSACGPAMATTSRTNVSIDVTPVLQHKKEVVCDIEPQAGHKKGEKIQLKSGNYTLRFELQPGAPSNVVFEADDNQGNCRAIYFDDDGCPENKNGSMPAGQLYSPRRISDQILEVDANVSGGPYAVHYRLNFNNNRYFDPVIIHD